MNVAGSDDEEAPVATFTYLIRMTIVFLVLWLGPTLLLFTVAGPDDVFTNISAFFSKMAVVTFGGAYAVLAYVSQEAVQTYGWLMPGEMIDGLAMAETTPGPLIMVTQFVGFQAAYRDPGLLSPGLAALLGSVLTVWVTFVPCFLWIFIGAPFVERIRNNRALTAALEGVTAAVVGVIVNLALWFGIHALFADVTKVVVVGGAVDAPTLTSIRVNPLAIVALCALLAFRFKVSLPWLLATAGGLGVAGSLLVT